MARILLHVLLIILILSVPVQACSEEVKVILDGEELDLEPPALVEEGRVLVPVRSFLEALGGEVIWDGKEREVIGRWGDLELIIPLDSTEPIVNGEEKELDVPVKVIAGCTYVPIRLIAESLGGDLAWDGASRTVFWDTASPGDLSVFFPGESAVGTEEKPSGEKISINSASPQKLQEVTGVDERLAQAIAEYRELNGPFWKIEDLLQVPGIDEKVFAAMKDEVTVVYEERGMASWYGSEFQGRRTASGEVFKQDELTAAHPELPFGTYVKVHFPPTGKEAVVRINDRGPHVPGRIIDLSRGTADAIGLRPYGVAEVIVNVMGKQGN